MKTGLVLGKFLPLHLGHIALIEFSLKHCDKLIVLVCSTEKEKIPGKIRCSWVADTFYNDPGIRVEHLHYNEEELPNTSVSSKEVSAFWAEYIRSAFPEVTIFFSSEPYGEYVAENLAIDYKIFDQQRKIVPVSGSSIMSNVFAYWHFIPKEVKPWFVKKVCISGSESTGKSTLSENLAGYFKTAFVPEMAREIIEKTEEVVFEDLMEIAELHAKTINEKMKIADKLLICDTDVNITKSYSQYLFNKALHVPQWIEEANQFDLHLFLETDCPFIQDGTRISESERNKLSEFHKQQLISSGISFHTITGNWQERFEKSILLINKYIFNNE